METPLIRFSLKDRGRAHTGKPRNFNVRAVADAINSPSCQEIVASRGMAGYYGHIPRVRFGMLPPEGVMDKGKYSPVEPAFVTTYLKADYDGNVEHRAEFLDNPSGVAALNLWKSKFGGFSAAIKSDGREFYGFDYVYQPNFLGNSFRGVTLDDAFSGEVGELTYDDIYAAEQKEQSQGVILLLDSIRDERDLFNQTVERLQAENEQLLSMLAQRGGDPATLDSAGILPVVVSKEHMQRMQRDRDAFMNAELPRIVAPEEGSGVTYDSASQRILDRARC